MKRVSPKRRSSRRLSQEATLLVAVFVAGDSAMAADWLAGAWDQNVALNVMSPLGGAVETVAAGWLLEILELPRSASVGFVTGAHMANVTALHITDDNGVRR